MMFDWIDDTYIQSVVPFSSAGVGLCNPQCGPWVYEHCDTIKRTNSVHLCPQFISACVDLNRYVIVKTDSGSKTAGTKIGLQIATSTLNRYFFVEYRTLSTQGNAAIITWTDVQLTSGQTGIYGIIIFSLTYSRSFIKNAQDMSSQRQVIRCSLTVLQQLRVFLMLDAFLEPLWLWTLELQLRRSKLW